MKNLVVEKIEKVIDATGVVLYIVASVCLIGGAILMSIVKVL